ncbi:MAG: transposase [Bacteroidales bacterium]
MQQIEAFTYGKYYHIYNRGINSCDIFSVTDNYEYFLNLYDKYISPIADTFAWVLMPNHFHFLVRIKEEIEIDPSSNLTGFQNLSGLEDIPSNQELSSIKPPHIYFSKLFNAYAKAYNKQFQRHGSLFERPFKRKLINNESYLKQVVLYIHNNPVHHGFCEHPMEYVWSSYLSCITLKPTKLVRNTVIGWFDDLSNFKTVHNQKVEITAIEKLLEI